VKRSRLGRMVPAELRTTARAIDLRWRGRRVDLLAIDETAETAWVIEIDSGFAHTVAVADLTRRRSNTRVRCTSEAKAKRRVCRTKTDRRSRRCSKPT
jgi:hypothetical protein